MIYIHCVHCGTIDFDARFEYRFKNLLCCIYVEPGEPPKKYHQLIFWASGEVGRDEHVRF